MTNFWSEDSLTWYKSPLLDGTTSPPPPMGGVVGCWVLDTFMGAPTSKKSAQLVWLVIMIGCVSKCKSTCQQKLQVIVEKLLLFLGDVGAGFAQTNRVDKSHPVKLDLVRTAFATKDLAATPTVMLQQIQLLLLMTIKLDRCLDNMNSPSA